MFPAARDGLCNGECLTLLIQLALNLGGRIRFPLVKILSIFVLIFLGLQNEHVSHLPETA